MLWSLYVRNVPQVKCPLSKMNNLTKYILREAMSFKIQDILPNIFLRGGFIKFLTNNFLCGHFCVSGKLYK